MSGTCRAVAGIPLLLLSLACGALPQPPGWLTVVVPDGYSGMALLVACPDRGTPLADDTVTLDPDGIARVQGSIVGGTMDIPIRGRRPGGDRAPLMMVGGQAGGGKCEYLEIWIGPPGPTPHTSWEYPDLVREVEDQGGTYHQAVLRHPL